MKALIASRKAGSKKLGRNALQLTLRPVPRKVQEECARERIHGSEPAKSHILDKQGSSPPFLMKSHTCEDASKKNGYCVEERPSLRF
jgi:hypothetical protein